MIPITLDPTRLRLVLIGAGPALTRRVIQLREGGAERLTIFAPDADAALEAAAFPHLCRRWPEDDDLAPAGAVWIVGLPEGAAEALAMRAHALGRLVNVEDVTRLCDFHMPALVRRGALTLAISTGGRSPGLAARLRRWLEDMVPEDWAARLEALAAERARWRREGADPATLARRTEALIAERGWLK